MVHIGIIPDGNRRWCKKNIPLYNKSPFAATSSTLPPNIRIVLYFLENYFHY